MLFDDLSGDGIKPICLNDARSIALGVLTRAQLMDFGGLLL